MMQSCLLSILKRQKVCEPPIHPNNLSYADYLCTAIVKDNEMEGKWSPYPQNHSYADYAWLPFVDN